MFIRIDASPATSIDERLGVRKLRADGGRQAITHRAEAAGRHPAVRLLEVDELGRPHLVLADLGRDVGVAVLGQLVETLDQAYCGMMMSLEFL